MDADETVDLKRKVPESWRCVDCGVTTAPTLLNRVEMENAIKAAKAVQGKDWSAPQSIDNLDNRCEVYTVRDAVWKAAGMEAMGGCLCIGCLEKRLGRRLKPKDFERDHEFNSPQIPGTPRLMKRRKDR